MLRRGIRWAGLLLGVVALFGAGALASVHWDIRRWTPPLPERSEIEALREAPELPVSLAAVNTASQVTPRAQVLDPTRDPTPGGSYVMSHPSFVLKWGDGRILLVDLGMTPDAARAFGAPIEWVGGEPAQPHGSLAEQLGDRIERVEGLLFTHLHTDHTEGVAALCAAVGERRIALFQTTAQARRTNYTTRPGRDQLLAADCLEPRLLEDGALATLPGFPGVGVAHVAGHTPGSQIVLAAVERTVEGDSGPRLYAITGDVANHVDGIRHDLPKPWLYRLLVVPEADTQLGRGRRFLQALERNAGVGLAVNHDRAQIESLNLAAP